MESELTLLKQRATTMGISFHPSIGIDKLREKIAEKSGPTKAPTSESIPQRNARLRKEANKLIRIRLTCMNPAKKSWPGEILSVSNSAIGTIKKYIPFEAEDGWHIPAVFMGILAERKYQSFYTVKIRGKKVKRPKLVKEFAIEILPDLTTEELKELAIKQARQETTEY